MDENKAKRITLIYNWIRAIIVISIVLTCIFLAI